MPRHRILLPALAAGALLVAPATAEAVLLKGTVSGAPYVATPESTAVPVIFSKQTAKRAGMRSPVGIIVIPRKKSVPSPQGGVSPSRLRLGDRFRFDAKVSREAKEAVYTRLATKKLYIYKRSKNLSTAELEAMVRQLQGQLSSLQTYVTGLSSYTVSQINSLRADLNALRADLEALRSAVRSLETLTADLKAQIDKLAADLAKAIGDISNLTSAVSTLQTSVGQVQALLLGTVNSLTGKSLQTVSAALADLTDIQAKITTVKGSSDYIQNTGQTLVSNLSTAVFGTDGTSNGNTDIQATLKTFADYLYGSGGTPSSPSSGTVLHILCNTTSGLIKEYNDLLAALMTGIHNKKLGIADDLLAIVNSTTPNLSSAVAATACAT